MLTRLSLLSLGYTFSKSGNSLVLALSLAILAQPVFSQNPQGINRGPDANEVICNKSYIKDPIIFYGNPMDLFTLIDGTSWKVSNVGPHEYIPVRYRNVLICPSEEILIVDKRAISVSRLN
jgi:hypothetical protein